MFQFITTTTNEPIFVAFTEIYTAWILDPSDDIRSSYYWRHRDQGEALEELLSELFVKRFKAIPAGEPTLNQIVNALITALDGGDYEPVLQADPVALYSSWRGEDDLLPVMVQGWTWLENRRIDRLMNAIFKLGERKFSEVMARRMAAYESRLS